MECKENLVKECYYVLVFLFDIFKLFIFKLWYKIFFFFFNGNSYIKFIYLDL